MMVPINNPSLIARRIMVTHSLIPMTNVARENGVPSALLACRNPGAANP